MICLHNWQLVLKSIIYPDKVIEDMVYAAVVGDEQLEIYGKFIIEMIKHTGVQRAPVWDNVCTKCGAVHFKTAEFKTEVERLIQMYIHTIDDCLMDEDNLVAIWMLRKGS